MLRVIEYAQRTDTGRQRPANEDSFLARTPLFAVADGMGGAQAGEVASRMAVEVLHEGLGDAKDGTMAERLRDHLGAPPVDVHRVDVPVGPDVRGAGVGEQPAGRPQPAGAGQPGQRCRQRLQRPRGERRRPLGRRGQPPLPLVRGVEHRCPPPGPLTCGRATPGRR